jgi:hypothetical protein
MLKANLFQTGNSSGPVGSLKAFELILILEQSTSLQLLTDGCQQKKQTRGTIISLSETVEITSPNFPTAIWLLNSF